MCGLCVQAEGKLTGHLNLKTKVFGSTISGGKKISSACPQVHTKGIHAVPEGTYYDFLNYFWLAPNTGKFNKFKLKPKNKLKASYKLATKYPEIVKKKH